MQLKLTLTVGRGVIRTPTLKNCFYLQTILNILITHDLEIPLLNILNQIMHANIYASKAMKYL